MKPGATQVNASNGLFERLYFQDITDPGTQRVNLFCDSDTGNDLTGNGTASNPYASIQRAFSDLANGVNNAASYFIFCEGTADFLVPDGFTLPQVLNNRKTFQQNPVTDDFGTLGFSGVNLIGVGTLVQTITAAQIVAQTPRANSGLIDIDVNIVLVPSAFARLYCIDATGFCFAISDNDANTINVVTSTALTPPFRIFSRPRIANQVAGSLQPTISVRNQNSEWVIAGFDIGGGLGGVASSIAVNRSSIELYGCRLEGGLWIGADTASAPGAGFVNGFGNVFESLVWVTVGGLSNTSGYFDTVNFSIVGAVAIDLGDVQISNGGEPFFGSNGQSPLFLRMQNAEVNKANGLRVSGQSSLFLTGVAVIDSNFNGVLVENNAYAHLINVGGTGQALLGLKAEDGAHVQVDALTDVTGLGGDLQSGTTAATTWVLFHVAKESADLLVQLTRIWEP